MTTADERPDYLLLRGLDGSNPLAFLAALGTLRTLSLALPGEQVKLAWTEYAGAHRPMIYTVHRLDEERIVTHLHERLTVMKDHLAFSLANDLSVSPVEYRCYARRCVDAAQNAPGDRTAADFAASFACDSLTDPKGKVQDTALRTMAGAGNQHFLKFMRQIASRTTAEHLHKTLFAPWAYDDPVKNQSLRWDPTDDSRHALQWRDPSGDPARDQRGGMLGANRLAIEGLPLIPCVPVGSQLHTTGFRRQRNHDTFWTWPLWSQPISVHVCCSLVAQTALTGNDPQRIAQLRHIGVITAFRSQRITVGQFRNFTPAVAVF